MRSYYIVEVVVYYSITDLDRLVILNIYNKEKERKNDTSSLFALVNHRNSFDMDNLRNNLANNLKNLD